MSKAPSAVERLDRAVASILDGHSSRIAAADGGVETRERPLVELASHLRMRLVAPPAAARFEARLGMRLAAEPAGDPLAWALRHPGRLIVTGAVGSAVGVGVTAYAVWRNSRRASGAHRLLHR